MKEKSDTYLMSRARRWIMGNGIPADQPAFHKVADMLNASPTRGTVALCYEGMREGRPWWVYLGGWKEVDVD